MILMGHKFLKMKSNIEKTFIARWRWSHVRDHLAFGIVLISKVFIFLPPFFLFTKEKN